MQNTCIFPRKTHVFCMFQPPLKMHVSSWYQPQIWQDVHFPREKNVFCTLQPSVKMHVSMFCQIWRWYQLLTHKMVETCTFRGGWNMQKKSKKHVFYMFQPLARSRADTRSWPSKMHVKNACGKTFLGQYPRVVENPSPIYPIRPRLIRPNPCPCQAQGT